MQQRFHHRAASRRSAPPVPKRRKRDEHNPFRRPSAGFEGLISEDSSHDYFFSTWIQDPDVAAEYLEHGERPEAIAADPRAGVTVSAGFHLLLVLFLLIEPSLGLLGPRAETEAEKQAREKKDPLVLFIEKPKPKPPVVTAVPLMPAPQQQPNPAEPKKPPQVADERMVIPKAMIPAPDEHQKFMNDLPFSKGNTDEFYTSKKVKEPGTKGESEKPKDEPPVMVPDPGKDATRAEKTEGSDKGNDGTDAAKKLDPKEVAALLFGDPRTRAESRPQAEIRPPDPRPAPGQVGTGGEDGEFSDIRRFLAGSQFHNPEGGLVSNTNNTLYYNDKGANFVPWLNRMYAEVRRNWIVPDSIYFAHGHVAVGVSVARDGTITDLKLLIPSGVSGFDNIAIGSLRASRLMPLPADYPDDHFEMILVFWYNERPRDIFG
jgi:outer membrane biosynthesis protein TonB